MAGPSNTDTLLDVLMKHADLGVDDYQRDYQWGAEQIHELYSDLTQAVDYDEPHFFGTLILQTKDDLTAKIVDGQQRLTTVFIFLATLRDITYELGLDTVEPPDPNKRRIRVRDDIERILHPNEAYDVYRLRPNRSIRRLMEEHVLALPSDRRDFPRRTIRGALVLRKATNQVRKLLQDDIAPFETPAQKLERVHQLFQGITSKFRVLKIVTRDLSESLDIFLTLNNRGLPLGPSDIVRGEIMADRGHSQTEEQQLQTQEQMHKDWEAVSQAVGEPEAFLRHYLVATTEGKVQKKKIVSTARDIYRPGGKANEREATAFWEHLLTASDIYSRIMAPSPEEERSSAYQIHLLERLGKSHRIMLLGAFLSAVPEPARSAIIRATFVLTFRWVMANQNAQRLEDFYQDQCTALRSGIHPDDVAAEIKSKAASISLDPHRYLRDEADSSYIARALLHAIHRELQSDRDGVPFESSRYHLEHIAPKSPTGEWLQSVIGTTDDAADGYERYARQAGNLLLLDKALNIVEKRKAFQEKLQHHYQRATLSTHTEDLRHLDRWGGEEIELRTQWLAQMFEILWSIEPTENGVIGFADWLTR
jgi:hypothetical protein